MATPSHICCCILSLILLAACAGEDTTDGPADEGGSPADAG